MFGVDGFVCESIINLNRIVKQALVHRKKLRNQNNILNCQAQTFPANPVEVDLQINLLPLKQAEKNPVGAAREKPNDDPFLPEPVRKVRSYFSSDFMKWVTE